MSFEETPAVWTDREPTLDEDIFDMANLVEAQTGIPGIVTRRMADKVVAWVALNHEALAAFWWDGADWTAPDVQAFIDGLKRV